VQAAVVLGAARLYGVAYTLRVIHGYRRQTAYEPQLDDWLWYTAFPLAGYLVWTAAAIGLAVGAGPALFAFAAAVVLLIFVSIPLTAAPEASPFRAGRRRTSALPE
jgi:hypothetical protein